jgi:two-component system LytT family response regulator
MSNGRMQRQEPVARLVRTIVVDDEPIALEGLRDMVAAHSWIEVVGEATSGPAAVELIDRLQPDLVLLDIQMPGFSGLDVLQRITHKPYVVFTTAFAQHAVTAFELGALDYLLKPFGATRLESTLTRVRAALGEPNPALTDRFAEAMRQGPMSRLFVRSGSAIIPIDVDEISYFSTWGDYVIAHVGTSRHILHLALQRLESRLDSAQFVRIHRTHIVNMRAVASFKREARGRVVAVLRDGTKLPVSRGKAQMFRDLGA